MARGAKQPPSEEGPPPRRGRAGAVANDAHALARAGFARAGFPEPGLVLRWKEIVGAQVARIARPLRFSEGATGGVLTLRADPAAAVFLQHESRALCGRINAWLGRDAVQRLRFVPGEIPAEGRPGQRRHTNAEPESDDPARRFSGSEPLKESLLALARARRRD